MKKYSVVTVFFLCISLIVTVFFYSTLFYPKEPILNRVPNIRLENNDKEKTDTVFKLEILPSLYNPAFPDLDLHHHWIFSVYLPYFWKGKFEAGFIREFNGLKVDYKFDCPLWTDYRKFHLARLVPCVEHELLMKNPPPNIINGNLPIADEEYFQNVDYLTAVYHAASNKRPLIAVELGARYGTWAARAGAAYRMLLPDGKQQLIAVEPDNTHFQWMKEHFQNNNFTDIVLIQGMVGAPPKKSLLEIIGHCDHVDYLDVDIQASELEMFSMPEVMNFLNSKTYFIHIGTHNRQIEHALLKIFITDNGWKPSWYFQTDAAHFKENKNWNTPYGPMTFMDGVLGVFNPRLVSPSSPQFSKQYV